MDIETSVDVYPDQTNVTVTITTASGDVWRVQTDRDGNYNQMLGCELWLNDDNDSYLGDHQDYDDVIATAERAAKEKHKELAE
jgi:hypothetical protein